MNTTLKTLSEVVDKSQEIYNSYLDCTDNILGEIFAYNDFLKQPLKLEFFIPCNDKGEPLEEPVKENYRDIVTNKFDEYGYAVDLEEYKYAKERVLFKGFKKITVDGVSLIVDEKTTDIIDWDLCICVKEDEDEWIFSLYQSISDLVGKVELTPNGIKQSGL